MSEDQPPTLDYASPNAGADWVTVKTYLNSLEAELAVALLRRQGIAVQVLGLNTNATLGAIYGGGVAQITLQVPSEEEEPARRMLDDIEEKRRERLQPRMRCSRCGAKATQLQPRRRQLIGLSAAVIGVIAGAFLSQFFCVLTAIGLFSVAWPFLPRWKCTECGAEWKAAEPKDQEGEDD